MADPKDIYVDRRVVAGSALAGLFAVAVAGFYVYNNGHAGTSEFASSQSFTPIIAGPPVPGGAPAGPGGTPAAAGAPAAGGAAKAPPHLTTSFDDAPASWPSGSGSGAPAAPAAGGGGPLDKLPPIKRGVKPKNNADPFVSWRIPKYEAPPAFSIAVPLRIASAYKAPPPETTRGLSPDDLYGPLPPVERRVAGVLYDGSVSAILETGTPGSASTDISIIMPGQTVPSGIPGIESLTVSAITATSVTLRAADGRTVDVKLSNVPAAYADAFHNAVSAGAPQQGPGGAGPGSPDGPPPPSGGGKPMGRGSLGTGVSSK